MISSHESYNSSSDLSEIFQRMFFDSEIAAKFSMRKKKSRYTILYGIAPEFKKVLLYDVKSSPFFTVCCGESLNTDLQMHQMDAAVRFWNDKTGLAEQDILTYNLSKGQLLRIYLTVCMNLRVNLKRINCCNSQ